MYLKVSKVKVVHEENASVTDIIVVLLGYF